MPLPNPPEHPADDAPPSEGAAGPKRNAAATRQRILEAGEHEFAARGFAGARLREIAVTAGVQPALIHHYFTDKRGLYRSVLDRAMLPSSTEGWNLLGKTKDLESLMGGLVDVLLRFYAANLNLLAILRHEALSGSNVLAEVTRERTLPIFEAVCSLVEERQASGEVRDDVPAQEVVLAGMSMVAYPFLEGELLRIVLPTTLAQDEAGLARRKQVVLTLLLDAIRPPSPPALAEPAPPEPAALEPAPAAPPTKKKIRRRDA